MLPHPAMSSKIHYSTPTTRADQDEADSDIEVLGPFPVPTPSKRKGKGRGKPMVDSRPSSEKSVTGVKDVNVNNEHVLKSLDPLFLQKAMESSSTISAYKRTVTRSRTIPATVSSVSTSTKASTVTATVNSSTKPRSLSKSASSSSATTQTAQSISAVETETSISTSVVETEPDFTNLPVYSYKDYPKPYPCVVYTRDAEEADDLIGGLKRGPLAFDMEWCFSRNRYAKERRTAVIQVADSNGLILVIHLSQMSRFPKRLQELIEDPNIPKLGANILNDAKKLFRDYGILSRNMLELGVIAAAWDPSHTIKRKIISLAKLAATYTGKHLVKGDERTSNWETPELTELQKEYAANDVHCTIEIFRRMQAIATEAGRERELPAGADVSWHLLKNMHEGVTMIGQAMRFQWRRAHKLWHGYGMSLDQTSMSKICHEMRIRKDDMPDEGPLKSGTVMVLNLESVGSTYVVSALQADPKLPFDIEKLRMLMQMEATSWERHRVWLIGLFFGRLEAQRAVPAVPAESTAATATS
ncbi:hypothetical protein H0H92_015662 [Tricholoma furcatifolium]|nr:hypothetical protein H0H92_015662 [Tricholoma furcatifolium]